MMSVIDFGEQLITTGDLDPVYPILLQTSPARRLRTIVAYSLFYDLGESFYLADQPNFWDAVKTAGNNVTRAPDGGSWTRGTERRHFRGAIASSTVTELSRRFPDPSELITGTIGHGGNLADVIDRIQTLPQFGPWISFKLCDIAERVLSIPIVFPQDVCLFYKSPRKSLIALAEQVDATPQAVYQVLLEHFANFEAPPRFERPCGVQEVETILCKYGSYLKGHYHIGKDTNEVRESLERWLP